MISHACRLSLSVSLTEGPYCDSCPQVEQEVAEMESCVLCVLPCAHGTGWCCYEVWRVWRSGS